jgi:hypothetical protein
MAAGPGFLTGGSVVRFKGCVARGTVVAGVVLGGALVVASVAAACPNEAIHIELRSAQLPDCRAYELVTPAFKEGIAVGVPIVAADGSRMLDFGLGVFSEAERNTAGGIGVDAPSSPEYEFVRGNAGWVTVPVSPPPAAQFVSGGMQGDASPDLKTTLWKLRMPSQPEGVGDLYRRESDGTFVHIGPLQPASVAPLFGNEGIYVGASQDLTHVILRKEVTQGRWPGDTTLGSDSLYEYGRTNELEPLLVGVKNEGRLASNTEAQLISQCETNLGSGAFGSAYNAISASGAIVYFTAHECGEPAVNELYARVDEAHTVALSEPVLPAGQCTGSCAAAEHRPGNFVGASEDGSKAFFTTEQPLLNSDKDATNDLYMAELEGAVIKRLVMVSEGETHASPSENDLTPGAGAGVLSVARISEDGSHVYFAATGILTQAPNAQGAAAQPGGADNLYVYDTTTQRTSFVATLAGEDAGVATPDGRFFVFVSHADPLHEGASGYQVYEYDATSGSLWRVSLGQHSSFEAFAPKIVSPSYLGENDPVTLAQSNLTMSDNGAYVFFESPDGLTPHAPDDQLVGCLEGGACSAYIQNVYEYHEGQVSLIASVRPTSPEGVLVGTDHSGSDVFFTTAEALVPQDTDTQRDIYDARIGGGFPVPAERVGCSGEGCHGPLSGSPPLFPAGSATHAGDGNFMPPVPGPAAKRTSGQKLSTALRACRKKAKKRRAACERGARKRYAPAKKANAGRRVNR